MGGCDSPGKIQVSGNMVAEKYFFKMAVEYSFDQYFMTGISDTEFTDDTNVFNAGPFHFFRDIFDFHLVDRGLLPSPVIDGAGNTIIVFPGFECVGM